MRQLMVEHIDGRILGANPVPITPIEVGGMKALILLAAAAEPTLSLVDADSARRASSAWVDDQVRAMCTASDRLWSAGSAGRRCERRPPGR